MCLNPSPFPADFLLPQEALRVSLLPLLNPLVLQHFGVFVHGAMQLMLFFAVAEGATYPGDMWSGGGDRDAGDLGFYLKKP